MSNTKQLAPWEQSVKNVATRYRHACAVDDLKWATEKQNVISLLRRSKDLQNCIPASIEEAVMQGAAMGLSFNPTLGHCYLIPRKLNKGEPNECTIAYASPSYKGLIHLQIESGAALAVAAEVVFFADKFKLKGPLDKPEHEPILDAAKRNYQDAIGVYALARLTDGTWRCEYLDKATIEKIRGMSEMSDGLMWNPSKFWSEGWKKAAIRRMVKSMPGVMNYDRMQAAIHTLNEYEGNEVKDMGAADVVPEFISEDQVIELADLLNESRLRPERVFKAFGIDSLDMLPKSRYTECKKRLSDARDARMTKETSNGE